MMDNGTGGTQDGVSLAELLNAADGTLAQFGVRASDVLSLGLDSLVQRKPDVRLLETGLVEFEAVAAELADSQYMTIEMRFALNDAEAYPVAVVAPFADLGRILKMNISDAEMADDAFARGQVELITQSMRELLDLSGLMLFIDALAGGEATVTTVRLHGIDQTIAMLQAAEQGSSVARIAFALSVTGEDDARLALLAPSALLMRLDALLGGPAPLEDEAYTTDDPLQGFGSLEPAAPITSSPLTSAIGVNSMDPNPMTSNPLADALPSLRSIGNFEDSEPDNISPLHSIPGGRAAEPEVSVHPVRFPPLTLPEAAPTSQQQMDLILDVPLRVSVELGRSSMTVEAVLALGPGSVVELNKLAGEPVDVLVNDRLIARGEVVVVDENFGVRVTEVISPRSRANAMAR